MRIFSNPCAMNGEERHEYAEQVADITGEHWLQHDALTDKAVDLFLNGSLNKSKIWGEAYVSALETMVFNGVPRCVAGEFHRAPVPQHRAAAKAANRYVKYFGP